MFTCSGYFNASILLIKRFPFIMNTNIFISDKSNLSFKIIFLLAVHNELHFGAGFGLLCIVIESIKSPLCAI